MTGYVPERGDLVWFDFSPQTGHEQAGRRPAIVLSSQAFNAKLGLAFLCPITSRVKGKGFEVLLPPGLPISGAVLVEHMRSVDWIARNVDKICPAPQVVIEEVVDKLGVILC